MSVPNGGNRLLFTTSFAETRLSLIEYVLSTRIYFTPPPACRPTALHSAPQRSRLYSLMLIMASPVLVPRISITAPVGGSRSFLLPI